LISIGEINEFIVIKKDSHEYVLKHNLSDDTALLYLDASDEELKIDQRISAFTYLDGQNNIIATKKSPIAMLGEYGLMTAVSSINIGAFFDWGIKKDLFVPENEQRENIYPGHRYIVRVCKDERTEKIYGTTKIGKYIKSSAFDIKEGDKVTIIPANERRARFRSIINNKYIGMIYYNEIFRDIQIGKPIEGVVKKLRDDGLVDAALQVQGFQNLVNSKDKIIAYLKENGGSSHLHDKSPPQEIRETLGMSKQTFKNTIGMLYRERKIVITKSGIKLVC